MALNRLEAHIYSEHLVALENILKGVNKPVTLSTVTSEDLRNAGVKRKRLVFVPEKIAELTKGLSPEVEAEIKDLHSRVQKIYAHVNMDHEPGSRMILDAILLALAAIASTQQRGIAILPEMRIAQGDVNVDYVVIEYDKVMDNKDRLLGSGGSREDAFEIASSCLILVEAKRSLIACIPKAVSQAIALLKSTNLLEVRFCLSDGQTWLFFILKSESDTLTYYESAIRRLNRDIVENSDQPLREIMKLTCEWLKPTATGLFELMQV